MEKLKPWTRIPRLFAEATLTERLDGHTAMIHVEQVKPVAHVGAVSLREGDVVFKADVKMDGSRTGRTEVWRVWARNPNRDTTPPH